MHFVKRRYRKILISSCKRCTSTWKKEFEIKFYEFGKENEKTMLLLNGFGSCWSRFMPLYHTLATEYHVITDAYDGFDPERPDTEFKSISMKRNVPKFYFRTTGWEA